MRIFSKTHPFRQFRKPAKISDIHQVLRSKDDVEQAERETQRRKSHAGKSDVAPAIKCTCDPARQLRAQQAPDTAEDEEPEYGAQHRFKAGARQAEAGQSAFNDGIGGGK